MFNVRKWNVQTAIFLALCGIVYFTFSVVPYRMRFEPLAASLLYQVTSGTNDNSLSTSSNDNNKNSGINCYSDSYWDSLVESDALTGTQIMEYFAWSNRSSCGLAHDFGGKILGNPPGKDGQKVVCIDPQVAPQARNCLVYSFGINNEWSFDEEMEEYGCQVFAFDPSMEMEPHDHTPGIHFYNWGLSDRDEIKIRDNVKWRMYSLSTVYDKLSERHGPNKIIDYLKMDIEGSEWKVLSDLMKTGMLSSKVRQIGLELHLPNYPVEGFRTLLKLVRDLERTGFVRFDSKYNPWYISNFTHLHLRQSAGYEIAWYNSQLLQPTP
jgi:hypothetical protein